MQNWPVRVYYEDTDAGGVVYYANYLKYMERARTEALRFLGYDQSKLLLLNHVFVVKSVDINYQAPARFDDELIVRTQLDKLRKASLLFAQEIVHASTNQVLTTAKVKVVSVTANEFKVCPMPVDLFTAFKQEETQ